MWFTFSLSLFPSFAVSQLLLVRSLCYCPLFKSQGRVKFSIYWMSSTFISLTYTFVCLWMLIIHIMLNVLEAYALVYTGIAFYIPSRYLIGSWSGKFPMPSLSLFLFQLLCQSTLDNSLVLFQFQTLFWPFQILMMLSNPFSRDAAFRNRRWQN